MSTELITINNYCELNKTSLKFKREVNKEEWSKVFSGLKTIEGCVQFWIGDCLKYREQKWGMYDDIAEKSGYDIETLRQYKQVSEQVESGLRNPNLGFHHHKAVAPLEPDKQEEFLQKAADNNWSVKELRDAIKEDKYSLLPKVELPFGKFNVIYADPPWEYDNAGISGAANNHYPTMSTDKICALKIPSDKNAVLFLWVTNPFLKEGFKVCEEWGFEYKTNMVWIKDRAGQGFYTKGQHEILFIAIKGNFRPDDSVYIKSVVEHKRLAHSEKPDIFYQLIEKLYPRGKKLELFGRKERKEWETWGNQNTTKIV